MPQYRYVALASFLLLGACAHAPPSADPHTRERIARVMHETLRTDSVDVAPVDLTAFQLPVQYNQQVQQYVDLYARRRRSVFTTWLGRMGRYREHIEEQLNVLGLPRELVYLPLIESAYEASAASHASAVGLWQFMKGTAQAEGLEVSEYLDERRDPIRSTEAALRHLQNLYHQFDSWYLAAAAYNSGSGRIARLLKEHSYPKGQDDAFWALQDALPKETRNYVPMLLGAIIVGENAAHFGISVEPEAALRFEVVTVPGATELKAVARAANTSYALITSLNPHFIKGITPPDRRSQVRIPVGAAEGFADAFEKLPADKRTRALSSTHVVRSGETLSGIARQYGTTVDAITRVNSIKKPNAIAAGRKLIIPAGT
jgi:membrane-bound lytic murein transglycosylase D